MRASGDVSVEAMLSLVGEAYAFQDLDEFRSGVIEVVNRAVPSDWVSYNEIGSDPDQIFTLAVPNPPAERSTCTASATAISASRASSPSRFPPSRRS